MNNRRKQLMLASAKEYCKCVVEGKTLKYNNYAEVNNNTGTWYGMSFYSYSATGVITISGTSTYTEGNDPNNYSLIVGTNLKANHKYLCYSSSEIFSLFVYGNGEYGSSDRISFFTAQQSTRYDFTVRPQNESMIDNGTVINETFTVIFVDLTALGLDSVANVDQFFATDLGKYIAKGNYLPYEPNGKFIHAQTPINFEGVNVWNEQWENGIWYNGVKYTEGYNAYVCTKDKIKVKPNTQYFYFNGSSAYDTYIALSFFDNNGAFIQQIYVNAKNSFTTPINCRFIAFYVNDTYGNVYNHDICINEYNIDYNRKYHKYCGTNVLMEGLVLQKGDKYKSWNGQLTKTMSLINLDNLSWTAEDFGMVAQLPSNFKTFEGNELASVIAEKYETAKYYDEIQDSICIADVYGYGYSVVIRYGNTQPSGFALFELATPTTENVTTRMISRRIINVESNNDIDLDFTKE